MSKPRHWEGTSFGNNIPLGMGWDTKVYLLCPGHRPPPVATEHGNNRHCPRWDDSRSAYCLQEVYSLLFGSRSDSIVFNPSGMPSTTLSTWRRLAYLLRAISREVCIFEAFSDSPGGVSCLLQSPHFHLTSQTGINCNPWFACLSLNSSLCSSRSGAFVSSYLDPPVSSRVSGKYQAQRKL